MKGIRSSALAAFACAMAVGVSAQQTPPAGGAQAPSAAASSNKVTVTGCLARPGAAATGTSGTAAPGAAGAGAASSTSAGAKFVLNNVMAAGTGSATAGTSGARPSLASSYQLDGDEAKLSPHVGHKIEITGTVEDKAAGGTSTAGAASTTAAPRLKVESVKMVSASCQ
jgi:hypothetical protein